MLKRGILNPQISSLLAHVRHTNMLVIADRGFPFWPFIDTVDISLVDGIPTVLDVFNAIQDNFDISDIFMANEFRSANDPETVKLFLEAAKPVPINFEPHVEFKKRVPNAIGLIRTADTVQYANIILVSGVFNS